MASDQAEHQGPLGLLLFILFIYNHFFFLGGGGKTFSTMSNLGQNEVEHDIII